VLEPYSVKAGDTLLAIAVKFRTTVEAIQRLNELSTDVIQPRTRLLILPGGDEGTKIRVDKSDYSVSLTVGGRVLIHRRVGLGRDNRTPVGNFVIKVKAKNPTWYPGGGQEIPPGDARNVLGSRWLGFEDTEDHAGFGIHATDNLADIGREASAGCIRLLAADMELLYDFVPYKTPVEIRD
jgi:lipoprotein-anchoring transpeptidase ErfK/SrfK